MGRPPIRVHAVGVSSSEYDAVVVGAGPNGLAAAITIARAGRRVLVLEAAPTVGGGARSSASTAPGFVHDVCSTVHAFGAVSPFFASLPLHEHGVEWLEPDVAVAHPLDDGPAAFAVRSLDETAAASGGARYRRLMAPIVAGWDDLASDALGSLVRVPRHPLTLARFGLPALLPATTLGRWLRDERTAALVAGCAAHAFLPLEHALTSSFALMLLGSAHVGGWPVVRGGSQVLADALAAVLVSHGGEVRCSSPVASMRDVPPARAVLFDLVPRQVAAIAADRLSARWHRRAMRYRHGPGVFKIDYALDGPVPWRDEACRRAGTLHLGGTMAEVRASEHDATHNRHAERPFVLAVQASVVDPTRAPAGKHTLWAYCHVPNGSTVDMTDAIERQIERFAPGFRDLVIARHTTDSAGFAAYNDCYVGGDIAGGAHDGMQLLLRPFVGRPYRTADDSLYICSAATPPGGGVHGLCGVGAAQVALRTTLR
jgi:phytoene dehydrogenase-like protein